ncbi:MAG: hypothetical protein HYZ54_02230, partial [Ignavibacteriae bacterium]|nr:hypothetical protein [Ignavibacteriota bacterium]
MRLILIFILFFIVSLASLQAQTKTYDIKYNSIYTDDPSGFGNFQQISSTRIISGAHSGGGWAFLLTIDNDGMIVNRWKSSFKESSQQSIYRYDKNSNTLVYIATELTPDYTYQLRLVLLDSNLTEKSNTVLDSSVTGMSSIFNNRTKFTGIILRDSTILWMSYFLTTQYIKGLEQTVLHLSKDGKILSRTTIADTNRYNGTIPVLQMPSGKILYRSAEYDPT